MTLLERYRFFHRNAGYVVGRRAASALALAKAELLLEQYDLHVAWDIDEFADDSFVDTWEPAAKKAWRSREHYAWVAMCKNPYGAVLACTSGIFDPDEDYRRVVAAELALEAYPKIATAAAIW